MYEDVEQTIIRLLGFRIDLDELIAHFGLLKIAQGKFEDARILFFKACQANPKSIISQLNLGKACYHLQQYDDACSALSSANILDPSNQEVWIYLIYCTIEDESKQYQLQPCIRELIKLEIENYTLFNDAIKKLNTAGKYREAKLLEEKLNSSKNQNSNIQKNTEDYGLKANNEE